MAERTARWSLFLMTSVVCLSPLLGQVDENALRDKFGPPVNGVFQVRPGITLNVTYGENHQLCKLDLRPTRNSLAIRASLIEELLNEIVPPSARGTAGKGATICAGLCWDQTEYEAVMISQASTDVIPNPHSKTQNSLAVVQFKSCQAAKQ